MDDRPETHRPEATARPAWLNDPDIVVFGGDETHLESLEQQGIGDWFHAHFGVPKEEVRANWEKVRGQISYLLEGAEAVGSDYELDEITFELGFSAEGQIVFVAKAGITTTISATFRRKGA